MSSQLLKRLTSTLLHCCWSLTLFSVHLSAQPNQITEPLRTEFIYEAIVSIGEFVEVGPTPTGHRRYIPITGGTFEGPKIGGQILAGGADWQTTRADGVTEADALYSISCDDGTVIIVHNQGVIADSGSYMRTALRFEAPLGKHDWLNRYQFISSIAGGPKPGTVTIRVFKIL